MIQRDNLTHVKLTWIKDTQENWLRFGDPVNDQIIDRRRRILSFAPGSIFAFIRWQANDYGTVKSTIHIVRAVADGEAFSTVPEIDPGGEIVLRINGWPKVTRVLNLIDVVDALGVDPCNVAPDYWRHVHNRQLIGMEPRRYTRARHVVWLLRQRIGA